MDDMTGGFKIGDRVTHVEGKHGTEGTITRFRRGRTTDVPGAEINIVNYHERNTTFWHIENLILVARPRPAPTTARSTWTQ